MRKHFLLLMLMALLPLAGWAADYDVTVTLGTINKVFGEADPALTTANFSITQSAGGSIGKDDLLAKFTFKRVDASVEDAVGASIYYTVLVTSPVVKDGDNYNVVVANNGFINVLPKALTSGDITYTIDNQDDIKYNGAAWTTGVEYTVKDGDTPLVLGTDYELVADPYGENTTVATGGTITIKGKGNYDPAVTRALAFTIATGTFTSVNFTTQPNFIYDKDAHTPAAYTVKVGNDVDALASDYEVSYYTDAERTTGIDAADIKSAGTYYVKVAGKVNLLGAVDENLYFTIGQRPIANADGTLAENFTTGDIAGIVYTGEALTPPSALSYKGSGLALTTDYTVAYANNTNATTETSKATITYTAAENGNFSGSFTKEFEIAKAAIAGVTIADIAAQSYNGGAAVEPVPAVTLVGVEIDNANFDIAYSNNTAQGTATVTLTPAENSNFSGENATKNFTIGKATLKVTPVAASKNLGTTDPTFTYTTVEGFGLLGDDASGTVADIITAGEITVTRAIGESAGTYALTVATTATADNYTIEAVNDPVVLFTINSANVDITATPEAQEYGYKLPATLNKDAFGAEGFTATGLIGAEVITNLTFTVKDAENNVYPGGTMLPVGTYTVTPSAADATSDSYVFNYIAGTLTVSQKAIVITAQPQNVDYSVEPVAAVLDNTSDTYVTIANSEEVDYTYATFNTAFGTTFANDDEFKAYFIDELTWTGDKTLASPGTINVVLTDDYSTNFAVTANSGAVTFTGVAATITLNRAAKADFADAEKNNTQAIINEYNGVVKRVTFGDFTMLPEKWYPLVLPFATDVATVSQKFGYAVVNILSDNQPDLAEGKVNLKLHMQEIAAGQPFVVKVYKEINMNTVTFDGEGAGVEISNATPIDEKTGVSFIGTYTGKTDGFRSNQLYFSASSSYNQYYPGNETNQTYLRPLGAYFELTNGATAREIIFQEADGSTTAIKVANPENNASAEGMYTVGGVKLQGAPTQKGVYIQNGKKVVIK